MAAARMHLVNWVRFLARRLFCAGWDQLKNQFNPAPIGARTQEPQFPIPHPHPWKTAGSIGLKLFVLVESNNFALLSVHLKAGSFDQRRIRSPIPRAEPLVVVRIFEMESYSSNDRQDWFPSVAQRITRYFSETTLFRPRTPGQFLEHACPLPVSNQTFINLCPPILSLQHPKKLQKKRNAIEQRTKRRTSRKAAQN